MKKEEIIKQIQLLSSEYYKKDEGDEPLLIEKLLKNYLEEHPRDTQMWLRLTLLYYTPYFDKYPPDVFSCLNKILEYDPENIYANIMVAFFHDAFRGLIPDEVFQKLNALKTNNLEDFAMLEMVKALYFRDKDFILKRNDSKEYEQCLQKAILLDPTIVDPYVFLGRLYLEQGKFTLAKEYLEKGLERVINPDIKENIEKDITSYEKFFNYFIKGTHLTSSIYKSIKEDLEKAESNK